MADYDDPQPEQPEAADASADSDTPAEGPVVSSAELLAGKRELLIQHGDDIYRLRITRNGKLILHK